MADPLGNFVPEFIENEVEREAIVKLAKMITDRVPQKLGMKKITKYDPEYWGLSAMCTDEMAEIALKMGVRKPKTLDQMVKLTGIEKKHLEEVLQQMAVNGVIEYNWENPQHEKQYVLPMFVPGSAEFGNMNLQMLEEHPEVGRFFERMSRLPLEKVTPMVPEGGAGIGMHVIPVEKAISMENQSISIEHISHWLDKYEGKYAASPCSCRRSRQTYEEGCADDPESWCIAVGDMADYVVETNKGGRYITREEALDILKKAEENGFVHQITNIDGEDKIFAICNCNVNVCYALRTSQLFNTPNMSRSAYVAKVETENCVACGRCVEYCPAGAVKLGQKLCRKDGSDVEYPKHVLPSEKKWGPEMWDENYRDNNRINCYDTGTAPCKTACPAHIAVQGYLKMAAQGRYQDALALIKKNNPLPAVCGHICNRRCEDACTRGTIDQAVAIDEIKKFIAEQEMHADKRYIPEIVNHLGTGVDLPQKIAIVGGGPAGLSAAFYCRKMGYPVTVFEKESRPGGMLLNGIPSFRLEKNIIDAEIEVLRQMGVTFKCGVEVGKDVTIQQLREEGFKAFYVAIGAQGGRKAGVPGEDADGVKTGVEFLRSVNLDESTKLSGRTDVVGGGNVAMDAARTAKRLCAEVHVVYRRCEEELPARKEEVHHAKEEGIIFDLLQNPTELLVDENGCVKGARVIKMELGEPDASGRRSPVEIPGSEYEIEADTVIMSLGTSPNPLISSTTKGLEPNRRKCIVAEEENGATSKSGVFAGGDAVTGAATVILAMGAGKAAAKGIDAYLSTK